MLGVLLAEVGEIGACRDEQLGDDGRHPAQVPVPVCSFQDFSYRAGVDRERVAGWIHLTDRRGENDVHSRVSHDGEVALAVSGIVVQVLVFAELCRIQEQGGDHRPGTLPGSAQ